MANKVKATKEKTQLKDLKALALRQGYVTHDQVDQFLTAESEGEQLVEEMEEAYLALSEWGIEVFDSKAEAQAKMKKIKRRQEQEEQRNQSAVPVRYDDPVRMYLREMGKVPLLDREGEVEIAMRIEEAENRVLEAFLKIAPGVRFLLESGAELKAEARRLDEFVQLEAGSGGEAGNVRIRTKVSKVLTKVARYQTEVDKLKDTKIGNMSQKAQASHRDRIKRRQEKIYEEVSGLKLHPSSLSSSCCK